MMGSFAFDIEDEAQRKARELQQRQADEDLQRVIGTPEGERVFLRLLEGWGAESYVSPDPKAIVLRNEAEELLSRISRISPATCVRMIAALRGITN